MDVESCLGEWTAGKKERSRRTKRYQKKRTKKAHWIECQSSMSLYPRSTYKLSTDSNSNSSCGSGWSSPYRQNSGSPRLGEIISMLASILCAASFIHLTVPLPLVASPGNRAQDRDCDIRVNSQISLQISSGRSRAASESTFRLSLFQAAFIDGRSTAAFSIFL